MYGIIVGISGSGFVASVLVVMAGWQLLLYFAPRYRYSSFIILENLSEALDPRSNMYPYRQLHRPLKLESASISGPWVLVYVFLPIYLLGLDAHTLISSVDPFDLLL